MKRVLVVGDLHEPACHPDYLKFVKDVAKAYRTDTTVFIGDLADQHSAGAVKFGREREAPGVDNEYAAARAALQRWGRSFPAATAIFGNHDRRFQRRAAEVGLPTRAIRNPNELWGTPWKWVSSTTIDGVLYVHGDQIRGGQAPGFRIASAVGQPVVCGHHHSKAGITWGSPLGRRLFGVDTGCGADPNHPFFRYGAGIVPQPVLACAVVVRAKPHIIVM